MSGASWNAPPPTYDAPTTSLTPYLTLPHLLSLTWLAYPILSLIFVAFRLQLSLADAQNGIASAKTELLASCKAAETAATSAASMPRFMAIANNKMYADAVNGALNAARATLILALTVMEAIINFLIDIYRSTFLCFVELVVRGGLAIVISAVQELNNVLQSLTSALRTSIQNDISSANNVIQSAINAINKVNPFGDITAPSITVPSLDSLQNVSLPDSFQQALTKLNDSIPSVADFKNSVEGIIDTPFELVKQEINETFAGLSFTPDGLPVPAVQQLSFCDQLDTSVVDDVGRDLIKMTKIGIVIIVLFALLLVGLNCLLTWYKWRCMKNHLEYTRQAWNTDPTMVHAKSVSLSATPQVTLSNHNLLMLHANSEHPLITRILNTLSTKFRLTRTQHINTQWFLHYIFYTPALACLLIGVFGLISVQIQLWAMGPLVAKYQGRAADTATDFSTTIATSINQSMYNQSSLYAAGCNSQADAIQSTINDGLFGWVNGTTTTLNTTINNFYSDVQDVVTTVFGGTILESAANEFLQCFLGSKVDAIENALTFLHDNLHIDIPRVNDSVLVLSPDSVNEAAQPIALAAIGGGDGANDDGGLIGRLVNTYAASLRKERIMFAIFIGLWGFVVLMGLAVVFWHSYGRRFAEKRGRKKWQKEQHPDGEATFTTFFNHGKGADSGSDGEENGVPKDEKKTHSFSPLPSPRRSVFTPFWASRSNSPEVHTHSSSSSQETVTAPSDDRPWEKAFAAPTNKAAPAAKPAKLLAIGRKAMKRGERLKKDGSDEEFQAPLTPPASATAPSDAAQPLNRSTVWFGKVTSLLSRKETQKSDEPDYWARSAMVEERGRKETDGGKPKPKLQIYTQRGIDKYGPPPTRIQQDFLGDEPQARSRFSVTPEATKTSYMSIMTPSRNPVTPTVVISPPAPRTSAFTFPYPPTNIPARPISRTQPPSAQVPVDVGTSYTEDPFRSPPANAAVFPIPLYSGFDTKAAPPRHPQLQAAFGAARKSPPPQLKNPQMMLQPKISVVPPPSEHRRSVSVGTGAQWRVTNAAPGDSSSSVASLDLEKSPAPDSAMAPTPVTPVTRLLTTTHARQSSAVNPFITPFDDEHQVQIDHATGLGARKSMMTNAFVHAI